MNKLLLSLSGDEVKDLKNCLDKQIRLLTITLENGVYNKKRPIFQEELKRLKRLRGRM